MADHPHTIDRREDGTGETLSGRAGDVPGGGEALAEGQDHAAQPGAGAREELAGLTVVARLIARPLQAEFLEFGAKVHEGGDWHQPLEQVERVK